MKAVHIKSIVICFLFGCSSSGLLAEQNLHNENARVVPQILSNVSVDEHDGLSAVQKNLIRGLLNAYLFAEKYENPIEPVFAGHRLALRW